MPRVRLAILIVLAAGRASAEPLPATPTITPAITPTAPRIVNVPTAWLQPSGQMFASAGANHRKGALVSFSLGVGGLAEVDVDLTDRLLACDPCTGERSTTQLYARSSLFKIGLATSRDRTWRLGTALGLRRGSTRQIMNG